MSEWALFYFVNAANVTTDPLPRLLLHSALKGNEYVTFVLFFTLGKIYGLMLLILLLNYYHSHHMTSAPITDTLHNTLPWRGMNT